MKPPSIKSRFIALLALLALSAGAYAQAPLSSASKELPVAPAAVATPTPVPPYVESHEAADDVLPELSARPVLFRQGVLVERLNGELVMEQAVDQPFNPASAVKLITALVALRTFGPKHRFATTIWIDGTFDKSIGTVTGNLIVSGRDPSLHYEHAIAIARELNHLGIRTVTGDLIVAPRFTMNFNPSSLRSGERFYDTLDTTRRPAAAAKAWADSRVAIGDQKGLQEIPSVAVMGAVYVDSVPKGARAISTHYSSSLSDVLKVLLCYSNNFMAERLGDSLGGPQGLKGFLVSELSMPADEVRLASTSGLGVNRLTPRQMMKVYRTLLAELKKHNLKAADILPVAGIDPGTLEKRYAGSASRGSVIAKTGTLGRTDGGASALVGQMRAKSSEVLLFVILNQRGSTYRFRASQDALINQLLSMRGGPLPFTYTPQTLAMRLSASEFDSTDSTSLEEFEPTSANP
jgi:D-alanyl-D-alanine carboxypeptidase/D-alanyl-D-alanine-endopeptidase (penicillin-binding protein 4)